MRRLLLLVLALVAGFIGMTLQWLPPLVASHFGGDGMPNGHMPRGAYLAFMLAIGVGVPLLMGFLPAKMARRFPERLNLPNREYWLAPERREATVAFVVAHGQCFAIALALFLAWVHWLVVEANLRQPVALSAPGIIAALLLFGTGVVAWLAALLLRFRRPS
jgi:hypothetical protein